MRYGIFPFSPSPLTFNLVQNNQFCTYRTHLEQHLHTQKNPHPDLLIRTSGEMLISNFLLF